MGKRLLWFFVLFDIAGKALSKPKAYIHIGPHKVASTYIQSSSCAVREALAEVGLHVPVSESCADGRPCNKYFSGLGSILMRVRNDTAIPDASFEKMPWSFLACDGGRGVLAQMRENLRSAGGRDVFISSEVLDSLPPSGVEYMRDLFEDYDVRILVLYREPLDHLVSGYTQHEVAVGLSRSVASYIAVVGSRVRSGFSLRSLLDTYCTVFGEEKVTIIGFEGLIEKNLDVFYFLLQNFAEREDLGPVHRAVASHAVAQNVSPPADLVMLWAFMQKILLLSGYSGAEFLQEFPQRNSATWTCLNSAAPRIVKLLGSAWKCSSFEMFDEAIKVNDAMALEDHPRAVQYLLNMSTLATVQSSTSLYYTPRKHVCDVDLTELGMHTSVAWRDAVVNLMLTMRQNDCYLPS